MSGEGSDSLHPGKVCGPLDSFSSCTALFLPDFSVSWCGIVSLSLTSYVWLLIFFLFYFNSVGSGGVVFVGTFSNITCLAFERESLLFF